MPLPRTSLLFPSYFLVVEQDQGASAPALPACVWSEVLSTARALGMRVTTGPHAKGWYPLTTRQRLCFQACLGVKTHAGLLSSCSKLLWSTHGVLGTAVGVQHSRDEQEAISAPKELVIYVAGDIDTYTLLLLNRMEQAL